MGGVGEGWKEGEEKVGEKNACKSGIGRDEELPLVGLHKIDDELMLWDQQQQQCCGEPCPDLLEEEEDKKQEDEEEEEEEVGSVAEPAAAGD
ncbi:unnamed protein product [Sphagnum balticum]